MPSEEVNVCLVGLLFQSCTSIVGSFSLYVHNLSKHSGVLTMHFIIL